MKLLAFCRYPGIPSFLPSCLSKRKPLSTILSFFHASSPFARMLRRDATLAIIKHAAAAALGVIVALLLAGIDGGSRSSQMPALAMPRAAGGAGIGAKVDMYDVEGAAGTADSINSSSAKNSSSTSSADNSWSCWDPHFMARCGVAYHAFALSKDRLDRLLQTATLGEEFWLAYDAATSLQAAMQPLLQPHEPQPAGIPREPPPPPHAMGPVLPIYLVTNYPLALIEAVGAKLMQQAGRAAAMQWPFRIVTVPFSANRSLRTSRSLEDDDARRTFVAKPDGLRVPLPRGGGTDGRGIGFVERVLYLDTDTTVVALRNGSASRRGAVASIAHLFAEMMHRTAYARERTWCTLSGDTVPPLRTSSSPTPDPMQDRRPLVLQLLCLVLDTLRYRGIAMAPEGNCYREMSPFLYNDLLGLGFGSNPYAHPQLLKKSVFQNSSSTSQSTARTKKKAKAKSFFRLWMAGYELQFNTGVVAYRAADPAVTALLQQWSHLHRSIPRCANDTVAWDQCSLPHALRAPSVHGRVVPLVLPAVLNFREALGRGCSPLLYRKPSERVLDGGPSLNGTANQSSLVDENIIILHTFGNKRAAVTRLRANESVSRLMTCFGSGGTVAECRKK